MTIGYDDFTKSSMAKHLAGMHNTTNGHLERAEQAINNAAYEGRYSTVIFITHDVIVRREVIEYLESQGYAVEEHDNHLKISW